MERIARPYRLTDCWPQPSWYCNRSSLLVPEEINSMIARISGAGSALSCTSVATPQ
jgi:hypothetical protein